MHDVVVALDNPAAHSRRGKEVIAPTSRLRHDLDVDVMAELPDRLNLLLDEERELATFCRRSPWDPQRAIARCDPDCVSTSAIAMRSPNRAQGG
jgi:hypothetical protein